MSVYRVKGLLEFGDVVVEELEVVGDFFFAADRRHKHDDQAASGAGDGVGSFKIEVGFDDDDLHIFTFHLCNQFDGVLWGGRYAGARLDVADDIEVEVFGEIGPRAVIRDDFAASVRFHIGFPALVGMLQALLKGSVSLGKIRGIAGAHLVELVLNAFGDTQSIFGVQPVMRIAKGLDVALRARYLAGGNFQNSCKTRSVQIAGGGNLNFRIAGLSDQRGKPADLQFESHDDEQIGFAEFEQKTGLGFDKVGVLVAACDGFDVHLIAADFLGQRGEVSGGGDDPEFGVRMSRGRKNESAKKRERCSNCAQTGRELRSGDGVADLCVWHVSSTFL